MVTGKIKSLSKKFGFASSGSVDYFFHGGSLDKTQGLTLEDFRVGDVVEFEPGEGEKGPRASAVRKVS